MVFFFKQPSNTVLAVAIDHQLDADETSRLCWLFSNATLLQETHDSILYSSSGHKLVAVKGLDNYVIMDTKNVLMICPRDDKQLKEITSNIGLKEFEEFR